MMKLNGKTAVILGGSSGIGMAIAQAVVNDGGQVVIASHSQEKLEKAKAMIAVNVKDYVLDVTDEQAMQSFFETVGTFDHLVSTAAGGPTGDFLDLNISEAKKTFEAKFWGQYYGAKYGAPYINKEGSITFCTGILSRKPIKGFSILSAINGGIEALTRALALELSPLRVNVVSPGIVNTSLYNHMSQKDREEYFNSIANRLPVRRIGEPGDIAQAFLYLMTNQFTTGTVLEVDGGHPLSFS